MGGNTTCARKRAEEELRLAIIKGESKEQLKKRQDKIDKLWAQETLETGATKPLKPFL